MRVGAASDNRNNSLHAKFGAFFNGPLEAIEFENRYQQGEIYGLGCRCFFSEFELYSIFGNADDPPATNYGVSDNIEFAPHAGTQNADEVIRMIANQSGAISGDFIGNPSSSRHRVRVMTSTMSPSAAKAACPKTTQLARLNVVPFPSGEADQPATGTFLSSCRAGSA